MPRRRAPGREQRRSRTVRLPHLRGRSAAGLEPRGALACRRGCFTNQRHWCQGTTAWRAAGNGRVRRAREGLRGMRAIDLSRREPVRLVFDHKQFPVRHLCETASVRTGSEVGVGEGGCSPTRARARCACSSSRIRPTASTPATPAIAAKEGSRRGRSQRRTVVVVEMRTFAEKQDLVHRPPRPLSRSGAPRRTERIHVNRVGTDARVRHGGSVCNT